jgi:hypothetical protein
MVAASGHGSTRRAIERQVRERRERGKTAWGGGAQDDNNNVAAIAIVATILNATINQQ